MNDFEPFDDDLAVALRRRAPDIGTTALGTVHAHDAVLARARGVRRRRAGIAGLATLIALIGGGVLLLNGNTGDDTLAPATEPPTSLTPATSAAPTTSSVASTSTTLASPTTTTPTTSPSTIAATTVAPPPVTAGGQSNPTNPPASNPSSNSSTSSSSSSSTSLAPQGEAPFTDRTYTSAGGSITVSWNGTALSLNAVNPAAGHTSETEDDTATRIRVRFRGPADSRIEIRVENGRVTERSD